MDSHNDIMTAKNVGTFRIYTINDVYDSLEIATCRKTPPNNNISKDVKNCRRLFSTLKIALESHVMLKGKISVSNGVTNGSKVIAKKLK